MKQKRLVNKDLLAAYRLMPCLVCGSRPSDPDHVITVKAGGDDSDDNLQPLCRTHHWQRHYLGLTSFVETYPKLKLSMIEKGFEFNDLLKRWMKPRPGTQ